LTSSVVVVVAGLWGVAFGRDEVWAALSWEGFCGAGRRE